MLNPKIYGTKNSDITFISRLPRMKSRLAGARVGVADIIRLLKHLQENKECKAQGEVNHLLARMKWLADNLTEEKKHMNTL